eukprot:CAMPEP_0170635840 /NCGR_PEP_ID=MMETSP0224-20130122/37447_1 /TAXON_ID=285029 /ORGANISM="Togula jolla, Strain CCCM 725" /LENGTH=108 /DNA_ID=CAMNT_0010965389 /DNA_START=33 /DNA_END=355 /DNA_ORIENTATION=+
MSSVGEDLPYVAERPVNDRESRVFLLQGPRHGYGLRVDVEGEESSLWTETLQDLTGVASSPKGAVAIGPTEEPIRTTEPGRQHALNGLLQEARDMRLPDARPLPGGCA